MAADIRELEHLLEILGGLMEPVTKDNWDDALETWITLSQMRSSLSGERCQAILKTIFAEKKLCVALGIAYQLRDINYSNGVPSQLLTVLKRDAGAFIVSIARVFVCLLAV
eukprot:SAG25_NODE_521_length_7225_cov_3.656890_8_plen_111_part_00